MVDHENTMSSISCVSASFERAFGFAFALILIVLHVPAFIAIALIVYLGDGRPILYRGERLGKDRKPFTIYKFRTLKVGAQQIIGGRLLSHEDRLTIRFGDFLRDTRLDELPQLFNILRGDINFIGPRPLRLEVYESICRMIPGYDACFSTKPGLIGCSQIFTPHSSPKRLRSLIDRSSLKRSKVSAQRLLFFLSTSFGIAARIGQRLLLQVRHLKLMVKDRQKRSLVRESPPGVDVVLDSGDPGDPFRRARLIDINEAVFRARCADRISVEDLRIHFRIQVLRRPGAWRIRRRRRVKSAVCAGQIVETRRSAEGWDHVISYKPETPLSLYVIHQYFLRKSLAPPFSYIRRREDRAGVRALRGIEVQCPTS
jgi:lipopolysaccharide/colanic/teichoic acid biosynthesis glycosyltransferase